MTFIETVKSALKDFKSLLNTIYFSGWQVVGYFLLLSVILSIPLSYQLASTFHDAKKDIVTISKEVPPFTIENNKLTVDNKEKGGIYLTNNFIVTLDENGKRSADNIRSDASATAFSIGFLPNELIIALPNVNLGEFVPQDSFSFPYKDILPSPFTKKDLQDLPNSIPNTLLLPMFLFSFLVSVINLLITLFLTSIAARLLGRGIHLDLRFGIVYKIVVFASTWGVLFSTVLQAINLPFDSLFAILIPTLWVYYRMLRDISTIGPEDEDNEKRNEEIRKKLPPL